MEVNQYQVCGAMPKKVGGPNHNIELVWKEIDRHERILKDVLRLLEELSEDTEKIKEACKQKVKGKKGKVKGA